MTRRETNQRLIDKVAENSDVEMAPQSATIYLHEIAQEQRGRAYRI